MIVTVHSSHTVQPVKFTPCKQNGWGWILENWYSHSWKPIPEWVKSELKLHPQLGVCSGMLITKSSAAGLDEFIQRVNKGGSHV